MPGLAYAYECDGCAACCVHFSVAATEDDRSREPLVNAAVSRLPLKMSDGQRYMNWDWEGGCPLLTEAGQCSIHLGKPDVCRLFKPGSTRCQWARGQADLEPLRPTEITVCQKELSD